MGASCLRRWGRCFLVFLAFGCASNPDPQKENDGRANAVGLPRYTALATMEGTLGGSSGRLPKRVYVFPPLRLDGNGKPVENYQPVTNDKGELQWTTPLPNVESFRRNLQNALRERGFTQLTFHEFSQAESDHGILVINPYFSESFVSSDKRGLPGVFVRVVGATFPPDLKPARKRELFNYEAVVLHNSKAEGKHVVRRAFRFVVEHLGHEGKLEQSVSLLD